MRTCTRDHPPPLLARPRACSSLVPKRAGHVPAQPRSRPFLPRSRPVLPRSRPGTVWVTAAHRNGTCKVGVLYGVPAPVHSRALSVPDPEHPVHLRAHTQAVRTSSRTFLDASRPKRRCNPCRPLLHSQRVRRDRFIRGELRSERKRNSWHQGYWKGGHLYLISQGSDVIALSWRWPGGDVTTLSRDVTASRGRRVLTVLSSCNVTCWAPHTAVAAISSLTPWYTIPSSQYRHMH